MSRQPGRQPPYKQRFNKINGTKKPQTRQKVTLDPMHRSLTSKFIKNLDRFKSLDSIPAPQPIPTTETIIKAYQSQLEINSNPYLVNFKDFIPCISRVYTRQSILFCIDVEAFEHSQDIVTEIGISIYDPRDQQFALSPSITQIHIRIKENLHLVNGKYVPNHANNFLGGKTYVMSLYDSGLFVQSLVDYYFDLPNISTFLVGHDLKGDVSWFNRVGVSFPLDIDCIDTKQLIQITQGKEGGSLHKSLEIVQIPHSFLHNAGNDAYFTVLLAMNLLDPQIRMKFELDKLRNVPLYLTKEEKLAAKEERRLQRLAEEKSPKEPEILKEPKRRVRKKVGSSNIAELIEINSVSDFPPHVFN